MSMCSFCDALAGQPRKIDPHMDLERMASGKTQAAQSDGNVELYECQACGGQLGRNLDDQDPAASWYVVKG